jgi:hypothetical protein
MNAEERSIRNGGNGDKPRWMNEDNCAGLRSDERRAAEAKAVRERLMPDGLPLNCGGECLRNPCATCPFARKSTAPNADRIARLEAKVERLFNLVYGHEDDIIELARLAADNVTAHTLLHSRIQNRKNAIKMHDARLDDLERQRFPGS